MALLLTKAQSSGGSGSGETNTASNVNVGGVGVFKQKTGVNLEFRGINAASSKISIALDAPNNEIDVDLGTVTLDNLSDVVITGPVSGQLLRFNGINWVNATTSSSGAYDTIQDEGTALTQRSILNFVGAGLTAVDNSLNSRTDVLLGNDLNALELLSSTGLAARVTTDVWALRGLVAPPMGFSITNPDGVAGNPTFVLANDLSAVEGLTTIGIAVRTSNALETWTTRTLIAGSNISITNPDGVAGNITIATTGVVIGTAYQTVQEEGIALIQRSIINFIGSGFTAADDAGNTRTNVTLDTDLNALANTVTTGLYTITGIGTSATRTIVAGSPKITVTDGSGFAGNPSIDLGTVNSTDIADFVEAAQDAVGTILIDSSTIDFTYSDVGNTITAAVINDTNTQRVEVVKNSGAVISTRKQLNFIEGSNITLTIADDGGSNQADITIALTTGASVLTVQEEGTNITATPHSTLNFVGSLITATNSGGGVAAITVEPKLSLQTVGGEQHLFLEDTTRSSKKLSVGMTTLQWAEATVGNSDFLQIGSPTDVDMGVTMPFNGTVVYASGFASTTSGSVKGMELFVNAVNTGTLGSFPAAGTDVTFTSSALNFDFAAGDKLRVRGAAVGGTVGDVVVTIWCKWRA